MKEVFLSRFCLTAVGAILNPLTCIPLHGFTELPAVSWELESSTVGRTTNGPASQTSRDSRASAGQWVKFEGHAVDDWIQFTLPNVPPGRHRMVLGYQGSTTAGAWKIEWREADASGPIVVNSGVGFHLPTPAEAHGHRQYQFRSAETGITSSALPGYRTVRFTRTSATESRSPIGFDRLTLIPAPNRALPEPTLRVETVGSTHQVLRWAAGAEAVGSILVERADPGSDEWISIGYAPSSAGRFDSAGLRPQTSYRHRIRYFSDDALGPASLETEAATTALEASPLGSVLDSSGARLGEGSIVRLKNGRLLMLLNYQDRVDDFSTFSIQRKESVDNGNTWSPITPMFVDPSGATGYLMPSILRHSNGTIGLTYSVRNNRDLQANRVFRVSSDEGVTWSDPVVITHDLPVRHEGLIFTGATGPHDRLIQTENGDLFLPVHFTTGKGDEDRDPHHDNTPPLLISATVVYRSMDSGQTWRRVFGPVLLKGTSQRTPYAYHWNDQVLSEPSLVEYAPGRLLLMMRNQSGFIQQARSLDNGETWSPVTPLPFAPAWPHRSCWW